LHKEISQEENLKEEEDIEILKPKEDQDLLRTLMVSRKPSEGILSSDG